jgi:hypothetical protein
VPPAECKRSGRPASAKATAGTARADPTFTDRWQPFRCAIAVQSHRSVSAKKLAADCRSLLAGDSLSAVTDRITDRLQAGSYNRIGSPLREKRYQPFNAAPGRPCSLWRHRTTVANSVARVSRPVIRRIPRHGQECPCHTEQQGEVRAARPRDAGQSASSRYL